MKKIYMKDGNYTALPAHITPAPGWVEVSGIEVFEDIMLYFTELAEQLEGEWEDC